MRSLYLVALVSFAQCADHSGLDPRRWDQGDWAIVGFNSYLAFLVIWMVAWIVLKIRAGEDLIDGPREESELRTELRRHRRWRERD